MLHGPLAQDNPDLISDFFNTSLMYIYYILSSNLALVGRDQSHIVVDIGSTLRRSELFTVHQRRAYSGKRTWRPPVAAEQPDDEYPGWRQGEHYAGG